MVTDSLYLNYSLNVYVNISFIARFTGKFINITVGLRALRSVVQCVLLLLPCFITQSFYYAYMTYFTVNCNKLCVCQSFIDKESTTTTVVTTSE